MSTPQIRALKTMAGATLATMPSPWQQALAASPDLRDLLVSMYAAGAHDALTAAAHDPLLVTVVTGGVGDRETSDLLRAYLRGEGV